MNRLWNEHFDSFSAARHGYSIMLEIDNYRLLHHHNTWRALKLMSEQYVGFRRDCQANTDFLELAQWITENQTKVLLAPLIFAAKRKTSRFTKMVFEDVVYDPMLNHIFQHEFFEEEIQGPGWQVDAKIYIPYSSIRFEDNGLKFALASFGLYVTELVYGTNDEGRYLDVEIMLFERNFKMEWDPDTWRARRKRLNDDDIDWEGEDDVESKIRWIEEGFLDDEDPRL